MFSGISVSFYFNRVLLFSTGLKQRKTTKERIKQLQVLYIIYFVVFCCFNPVLNDNTL